MKKYIWVIIVIGFLIVFWMKYSPKQLSPLNAIPSTAAVAFYVEELSKIYSTNKLDSLLPEASGTKYTLNLIAKLEWAGLLEKRPAAFVAERSAGLLILDIGNQLNAQTINQQLKKNDLNRVLMHNFKGHEIYVSRGDIHLAYAVFENLLLLSKEAIAVESALEELLGSRPASDFFRKKPEKGLTVFLQTEFLTGLFAGKLSEEGVAAMNGLTKKCKGVTLNSNNQNNKSWTGSIELKEEHVPLALSGISEVDILGVLSFIPHGAEQFSMLNLDLDYIRSNNDLSSGFSKYILPWMESEAATVVEFKGNAKGQNYWAIRVDKKRIESAKTNLSNGSSAFMTDQPGNYGMFSIATISNSGLLEPLGIKSSNISYAYTFLEEYVVFANSRGDLELLLDDYLVSNNKAQNENLLLAVNNHPMELNAGWFNGSKFLGGLFSEDQLYQTYNSIQLTGFLSHYDMDKYRGSFSLILEEVAVQEQEKAVKIWQTNLKANVVKPPFIYKDHIFIQDKNNILYALNLSGEVLWERQLNGIVKGEIQFRDIGKTPVLLYNTSSEISVMDLSGNTLPGFPILLVENARNSMTIVDFEHNNNFAFFVPCGNKVYGYEWTGEPIVGWNPLNLNAFVYHSFGHFQYGGKDYFYGVDESPQLLVFDRWGEPVFLPFPMESSAISAPFHQLVNEPGGVGINRIVACDSMGKVLVVNPLGEHFKLRIQRKQNSFNQFVFADFLGDKRKDYLTLSGNEISLDGYDGLKFINYFKNDVFPGDQTIFSINSPCENKSSIGVFSRESNMVCILKKDGSVLGNFPLAATQPLNVVYLNNCKEKRYILVNGEEVYAVD
jgi:hypothetical protein